MRPINRGAIPILNGQPKTVSSYRSWRADLIDRLGFYCCFCNMPLKDSPQVEHVVAQDIDDARALDWDNMLLACGPCNRTKSATSCPPSTHYLPQYHNTHLAFEYFVSASIINGKSSAFVRCISKGCDPIKANNTIKLCALDRDTTHTINQATDLRWKYRCEVILTANIWRKEYDDWGYKIVPNFTVLLKTAVEGAGFWSIWYNKFWDVLDIRKMLVKDFPGTDLGCFDPSTFLPVAKTPRNPGDLI
jgi:hypothetical protein